MISIKIEDLKLPKEASVITITRVINGLNRFYYRNTALNSSILPMSISLSDIRAGLLKYDINASIVNIKAIIDDHIKNDWEYKGIEKEYLNFTKLNNADKKVYIGDINSNILYYTYSTKGSLTRSKECSLEVFTKAKEKVVIPEALDLSIEYNNTPFNIYKYLPECTKEVKVLKYNIPYIQGIEGNYLYNKDYMWNLNYYTNEVNRIIELTSHEGFTFESFSNHFIVFKKEGLTKKVFIPNIESMYIDFQYSLDNRMYSHKSRISINIPKVEVIETVPEVPAINNINIIVEINSDNLRYKPSIEAKKIIEVYV